MKIVVLSSHKTSAGVYLLCRQYGEPEETGDMAQDDMFLVPRDTIDECAQNLHITYHKEVMDFSDEILKLFELPKVTKSTPGLRVGRIMKFVLKHFYERLESEYVTFDEFAMQVTIRAALEVYQEIAKRSAMDWLNRNHYQFVSKHEGLMLSDEPGEPMGPFPYTQIRTHYPREDVVLCQWKLGDDGLNEIVVHDQAMGGKRIVDPIVTMDVHRNYRHSRIGTLEQIVEERITIPRQGYSAMATLIRSFYMVRRAEAIREVFGRK